MKSWIAILIALLLGLLYLLNKQFPYILADKENYLALLSSGLVLAVIILGVARRNVKLGLIVKSSVLWLAIALVILTIYSYQYELKGVYYRLLGNLVPSMGRVEKGEGTITFYADQSGHFMFDAKVNGQLIHFLLDTGATKTTLSARDAKRVGIDLDSLVYDIRVNTAKGISYVAYTKINTLQVGEIIINHLDAHVAKDGLSGSLLGMNFLNRLSKYEVDKGAITLWE